ncbi:MAG: histidine phosphatase family protein [Thermoguttaceae bacterium]|jgi:phosphohistidine phosphatase
MDLFIIRHAWAAQRDDSAYSDDSLRPLTDEGRSRFARMVGALVIRGLTPQLILTSPMLRCVQTAEILATALGKKSKVLQEKELLPGTDPKHLLAATEEHAGGLDQVAWVGHAPDVGYLVAALIGLDNGWLDLKKGAIAALGFPGSPELGRGELRWLVTAKILGV